MFLNNYVSVLASHSILSEYWKYLPSITKLYFNCLTVCSFIRKQINTFYQYVTSFQKYLFSYFIINVHFILQSYIDIITHFHYLIRHWDSYKAQICLHYITLPFDHLKNQSLHFFSFWRFSLLLEFSCSIWSSVL